ncbi:MAG: hypothetical protein HY814_10735 [Candidatus Riflebacteria bacterium]|nr:hypothetical protein [Candidatus Riflebacteria bacterium]
MGATLDSLLENYPYLDVETRAEVLDKLVLTEDPGVVKALESLAGDPEPGLARRIREEVVVRTGEGFDAKGTVPGLGSLGVFGCWGAAARLLCLLPSVLVVSVLGTSGPPLLLGLVFAACGAPEIARAFCAAYFTGSLDAVGPGGDIVLTGLVITCLPLPIALAGLTAAVIAWCAGRRHLEEALTPRAAFAFFGIRLGRIALTAALLWGIFLIYAVDLGLFAAIQSLWGLQWAVVLGLGVSVVTGLIVFYLCVRYSLAIVASAIEGLGPRAAVKRSVQLFRRHPWRVAGFHLVGLLPVPAVGLLLSLARVYFSESFAGVADLGPGCRVLLHALLPSWYATALAVFYYDLLRRHG